MKHSTQVQLIHQIFDAIDRGMPPMADRFTRNDTSAYTSPERAAREREVLFRHHPIVAGFSSQIPNPGDYLAEDLAPVPILIVRNTSGQLRAFVNVCRHRGAQLAAGCGRVAKLFSCPYHGWSYDTDGRLVAIPDDYGFEGLDRTASGLVALPVAEKYGLIFVTPAPGDAIDIDAMLAGLGQDIESYGIGSFCASGNARRPPPDELEAGQRHILGGVPHKGAARAKCGPAVREESRDVRRVRAQHPLHRRAQVDREAARSSRREVGSDCARDHPDEPVSQHHPRDAIRSR